MRSHDYRIALAAGDYDVRISVWPHDVKLVVQAGKLSRQTFLGHPGLAAVLWAGGISFGGVVSFIFADLLIIPILVIYGRYYGRRMAWADRAHLDLHHLAHHHLPVTRRRVPVAVLHHRRPSNAGNDGRRPRRHGRP